MASCRSCHAEIRWVTTEGGKAIPIDHDPVPDGNIIPRQVDSQVVAHVLGKDEVPDPDQPRFVSHFATCPNANEHRKKREQ